MTWIIDASVALRWLLEDEAHANSDIVLERLVEDPTCFAVPELFAFEVFSVIQRLHPDGVAAYTKAIIPILQSGIFRQPMTENLAISAIPYMDCGLTGYDATYAALAKDMNGKWLTYDRKAHNSIKHLGVSCLLEKSLPPDW